MHYGARIGRSDPETILEGLNEYASWAKEILVQHGMTQAS